MADRQKVLKGLEWVINDIEENGNINHAGQYLTEIKDALELLKENDIELERIYQNICTYINGGCSTDTEADKEYICSQIDRIFEGKPVLLDEEVKQDG